MTFSIEERHDELVIEIGKLVELSTRLTSNPEPERRGGIASFLLSGHVYPLFSVRVGEISDVAEWDKYWGFSREKVYRVQSDFLRDPNNIVSSWQTREPEIGRYGGAVIFNLKGDRTALYNIISFSGLDEQVDEAVALTMGFKLGWTNKDFLDRVLSASENHVFWELLKDSTLY